MSKPSPQTNPLVSIGHSGRSTGPAGPETDSACREPFILAPFRHWRVTLPAMAAILAVHVGLMAWLYVTETDKLQEQLAESHRSEALLFASILEEEERSLLKIATYIANEPHYVRLFAEGKRTELLDEVLTPWRILQDRFGMRQLHFHLPPATSFLRVHKPEKYGDDLTGVRHTIVRTNRLLLPTSGFEVGRVISGLRGVVPVFDGERHVGSVEVGSSHANLLSNFCQQVGAPSAVFLHRNVLSKNMWKEDFHAAIEQDVQWNEWILDSATNAELFQTFFAEDSNAVLVGEYGQQRLRFDGRTYQLNIVPLPDFKGDNVGKVVWLRDIEDRLTETSQSIEADFAMVGSSALLSSSAAFLLLALVRGQLARVISQRTTELREREEQFRSLVENIPGVAYRCEHNTYWAMHYVSESILQLTGYPATDFLHNSVRSFSEVIHPDDAPHVTATIEHAIREQTQYIVDYRILHRNKRIRWVHEKGSGVYAEDGRLLWLDGVIFDVTQQKAVERALHDSESRHRAITEKAHDAIILSDTDGKIRFWNPAAQRIFGFAAREAIGQNMYELLIPASFEEEGSDSNCCTEWLTPRHEIGALGTTIEMIALRNDGIRIPVEMTLSTFEDENGRAGLVVVRDITDRKRAEMQNHRLAQAVEAAADAIVLTDGEGRIVQVNPAFSFITGYATTEALGRTPRVLKSGHHTPDFYEKMWQVIRAGQVWSGRVMNRRKDGSFYPAALTISPILDDRERVTGYVGIQRDVSSLVEQEEELRETNAMLVDTLEREKRVARELEATLDQLATATRDAQSANQAKSEFLANMSHELRTPLHGILSFSSFGIRKHESASREKLLGYFDNINKSGKNLLDLLNDLLDLAKLEAGRMQYDMKEFDLQIELRGAVEEFASLAIDRGVRIDLDSRHQVPMIGDSVRLRQVFRNILSNAMKFTPNNDIIAVGVKRRDSSVRIAFADHGPGVPEEELEAVFDKFIQSSKTRSGAGGTGLGLAICREIVESHDGRIWAENQPEGGACFIIELPLANAFAATNSQGEAVGSESTEPLSATASGST